MEGGGTDTAHTHSRCLGQHRTTAAGSRKDYLEIKGWKANSMDNTHNMSVSLASGSRLTAAPSRAEALGIHSTTNLWKL